jgi:glutathione synthase/RimK-type ligase-like ATP-grasp enzyme
VFDQLKVALATFRNNSIITSADDDIARIVEQLQAKSVDAGAVYWDEPDVDWSTFDLIVIRSTWDYSLRHDEFFSWVDRSSSVTHMLNPPRVLRWNAYKDMYMRELAAKDLPVVPTTVVRCGEPIDLPEVEFVVKPNVGGGSRGAGRYRPADAGEALAHVRQIHDLGLVAMIQPYVETVDRHGERALVFINGTFVHAIRKGPVLSPGARSGQLRVAHPGVRVYSPSPAELALAKSALALAPEADRLLYGRVDLVSVDGHDPMIMELELVEPNLFLKYHQSSMDKVVTAIADATAAAHAH